MMKTIAILGKPNVGKSSLFNRLCNQLDAITSDVSGTTRDIKKGVCRINGISCILLDTGGIDAKQNAESLTDKKQKKHAYKQAELFKRVSSASIQAGLSADLVLYMVDGRGAIDDEDKEVLRKIQKHKRVFLVLNKIDNDKLKEGAWEFQKLGVEELFFISVSHNRGLSILLESIGAALDLVQNNPDDDESLEEFLHSAKVAQSAQSLDSNADSIHTQSDENLIKVGIIGRVNVGKSSLLNALLGIERSIVSDVAGTTIDPVDECIEFENHTFAFIDTAGIRRAGKIEGIEKYALDRTNKALEKSHIALLVLDASEGFVELDEKISALVPKHNLGVIIVLNKWDKAHTEHKAMIKELRYKFRFLEYAPVVCVSALTKRNITTLKKQILAVWENFNRRIPTSELNALILEATKKHHLPSDHGKIVKIYYATQFDTRPPQISLVMNRPKSLHFSYKRYLVNSLRECYEFSGVPILISPKDKKGQDLS